MAIILGISAFYHDSAAALLVDGNIVACAQEERFSRKKHDPGFPEHAIRAVLSQAGLSLADVDSVAFYDKPFLKFERLLETYLAFAPKGFRSFQMAMPVWLREKLFLKDLLVKSFKKLDKQFSSEKLYFSEHHFSHAASAFYPSPFEQAAVLTLDGVGEWSTTTLAIGKGHTLSIEKELHFPHSLGLLYSAFTYYTGFRVNSGEYKVMGLAPYGQPRYVQKILDHLIDVKPDGTFRLNQKYFNYATGLTMTNRRFEKLFGQPARKPDTESLTDFHMDIAASIQAVTEEIVLKLGASIAKETGMRNLCLAGGVALNCVANGKLLKANHFDNIWVQPAAGDAGGALGAALALWHQEQGNPRVVSKTDSMKGSYLGHAYTQAEIETHLTACGAVFETLTEAEMIDKTVSVLADGKAVGWFQGRMEFGPRALGGRSILGDPRSDSMQKTLNLKVKFRESFRPFAPSILRESVSEWFDLDVDSPYMLLVDKVNPDKCQPMTAEEKALFGIDKLNVKRSVIPAVTHVDYTARVQTVHEETNPRYHRLLKAFQEKTGCPILINTSFNVRGEPIVGSPADAFRCFMGTHLDYLVIGNCVLDKTAQKTEFVQSYQSQYALD